MRMSKLLRRSGTLARFRRTTAHRRIYDGRETLARAIGQLTEMQDRINGLFRNLQTQVTLLNRIRHDDAATFSSQIRARVMGETTRRYQADAINLYAAVDGLLRGARLLLSGLQESDTVHMDSAVILEFQEAFESVVNGHDAYLQSSPLARNQAFIDNHRNHTAETPPDQTTFGPNGGSAFGVLAAEFGVPEAITTYQRGYRASWATQARLFANGDPVGGDFHRRRYRFKQGGKVEIQAHQPLLTMTARSDWNIAAAWFGGAVAGAVGGLLVGGIASPVFAVIGAAALGGWALSHRPYDAAWQGYTAHYYARETDKTPWGTQYFYGWKYSSRSAIAVDVGGEFDPQRFENFADRPQDNDIGWYRWRSGNAAPRAPDKLYEPPQTQALKKQYAKLMTLLKSQASSLAPQSVASQVDVLVQSMTTTFRSSAWATTRSHEDVPLAGLQPPLITALQRG